MGILAWIFLIYVMGIVFVLGNPQKYPEFFDEDDLQRMGMKHNPWNPNPVVKASYVGPTVTGRYTEHPKGYVPDPYGGEARALRPLGLPQHKLSFKGIGRGNPLDQNVVQEITDAEAEQVFPDDDGAGYSTFDFKDLDELPKRLTQTGKWAEFKELVVKLKGHLKPGEVMKNWEQDAHRWALYSRHLLARKDHEEKKAARMRLAEFTTEKPNPSMGLEGYWPEGTRTATQNAELLPESRNPSDGLEGYWPEDTDTATQPPRWSAGPMWSRRSYDEYGGNTAVSAYDEHFGGSMDRANYPPIYYKSDNQGSSQGYQPDALRNGPGGPRSHDLFVPGQSLESMAGYNFPSGLRDGSLEGYQPPYPPSKPTGFGMPQQKLNPGRNPDMSFGTNSFGPGMNQMSEMMKRPGPGSEGDFPNGYRPFGDDQGNSPFDSMQGPGGNLPTIDGEVQGPRGNYPQAMPRTPGQGSSFSPGGPMYNIPEPGSLPKNYKALRNRGAFPPGNSPNRGIGPGSEKDLPNGYRPFGDLDTRGTLPRGNVQGNSPMGNMQQGFPGDMKDELPPPDANGVPLGFPTNQLPQNVPERFHQYLRPPGNMDDELALPGPSVPEEEKKERTFAPKMFLTPGNRLAEVAMKKLAALDKEEPEVEDVSQQDAVSTTARPLTTAEKIKKLRQLDDFGAPISWVKFNSPETIDGLARVTDKKTHHNQQYVFEGELYVPIIDESMARLGWTTEAPIPTTTGVSVKKRKEEAALRVVVRSLNLNETKRDDWLAHETVLGAKRTFETKCTGESCQSRCSKMGCDSVCKGDTCGSGCVGVNCNGFCKGPGCRAMCIGDYCHAKCDGVNCDSRCWGKECEASCQSVSCQMTANGVNRISKVTWDQMYPQYGGGGNPDFPGPEQPSNSGPMPNPKGRQNEPEYYED